MNNVVNAISVDVEDYYQVEAFSNLISRDKWDTYPSRVAGNNEKILRLFDEHGIKGTFFVLGCVAERDPGIVNEIHAQGHEVACHGFSHRMILKQSRSIFKQETQKAKDLLEDIIGEKVKGYRAATYSITKNNLWALEILMDSGFEYDSSIFPIRHDRYGISDFRREPCLIRNGDRSIKEFPISTSRLLGGNLPVSGGGYFRLYPYMLTRWGLSSVNAEGLPFVFYLHPWEVDPAQPKIEGLGVATRFRHYINLDKTENKLKKLLDDFKLDRMDKVLDLQELPVVELSSI
jgi:polysaccharide deacetylase family protein (PEP-CTERM system associated)